MHQKFSKELGILTKSLAPKTNILVTNAGYQDPFKRALVFDHRALVDIPYSSLNFCRAYEFSFIVGKSYLLKREIFQEIYLVGLNVSNDY